MKVIITGASGFVGQNLIPFLSENNFEIVPLSLRTEWRYPEKADAIIHLAGKAHDTSQTVASDYFRVNRDLTIKLYEEFLKSDTTFFFYFSSVKATADTVEGILDETHYSDPETPYGKSKLEAENYLLKQDLPVEKKLYIIRPCMIHGPGNKGNLNLLYDLVAKGIPWPLASFVNKRSFLSSDNLNFLILSMLTKEIPSGIYNFADDESVSTNDLVQIIGNITGKKGKLWKWNTKLISGIAKAGDLLRLPLNSERLKKLTESYVVSNKKVRTALGISTLPFSTKVSLEKTIKSFQR